MGRDRPDGAHRALVGRREMIARRTIAKAMLVGLMTCALLVSVSQAPRVWEWASYGEWIPIFKYTERQFCVPGVLRPDDITNLEPIFDAVRRFRSLDSKPGRYFKAKQKNHGWLPGPDFVLVQVSKEEFRSRFPKGWEVVRMQLDLPRVSRVETHRLVSD